MTNQQKQLLEMWAKHLRSKAQYLTLTDFLEKAQIKLDLECDDDVIECLREAQEAKTREEERFSNSGIPNSSNSCQNGYKCPYCELCRENWQLCEQEVLRDVKKLYRPFCYWVKEQKDKEGEKFYTLTIFHGRPGKSFSDGWASKTIETFLPAVEYLKSLKIEKEEESLI